MANYWVVEEKDAARFKFLVWQLEDWARRKQCGLTEDENRVINAGLDQLVIGLTSIEDRVNPVVVVKPPKS